MLYNLHLHRSLKGEFDWMRPPASAGEGGLPGINSAPSALSARHLSEKYVNEETTVCLAGWVRWSVFLPQPLFPGFGLVGKGQ